jgi:transcriptional regulator with XRE-family HTH domain
VKQARQQTITVRFGTAVRARRLAIGISQEELASRAGLHRTYVGDVERGVRNISLNNIRRLAAALGCRASELLRDAEADET